MCKLTLEIEDLPDGTIAIKCSSDVDIDATPLTPAIILMSTILGSLQEGEQTAMRMH